MKKSKASSKRKSSGKAKPAAKETSGRNLKAGVARQDPYIDILPREVLLVVADALDDALGARRRSVWPATLRSGTLSKPPGNDDERAVASDVDMQRVLVPLARLGGVQGYSGASVFVAYFQDQGRRYLPSRPLVVKIGTHEKLSEELKRANCWPPHAHGEDSSFACPWRLFPLNTGTATPADSVLIAPFSSVDALDSELTSYDLEIEDLWRVLTLPKKGDDPVAVLRGVYELMHGIHRHGRIECERRGFKYGVAYRSYLRKLHTSKRATMEALFGKAERTKLLGQTWPNPLRLVDKLVSGKFDGAVGPIHGDLHPKNIVLDKSGRPRIIDFGWALPRGHVVVDYVLMEVNLRALTLSSQISHQAVLELAKMLDETDPIPKGPPLLASRASLIRDILWKSARAMGIVKDWTAEYLIPQFLVAFGLLKFLDSARNQHALLGTVLSLGKRIDERTNKKAVKASR